MGEYARAIADFDQALRLRADHKAAYFNRALSHEALGDSGQAIRDLQKACELGHRVACQQLQRN